MTFLADENFPRPAVESLRNAGIDVLWIAESNPGAPDDEVLTLNCGIVLFRLTPQSPDEAASIAVSAIRSQKSWAGHFSVITRQRIRMRPLPLPRTHDPEPAE